MKLRLTETELLILLIDLSNTRTRTRIYLYMYRINIRRTYVLLFLLQRMCGGYGAKGVVLIICLLSNDVDTPGGVDIT